MQQNECLKRFAFNANRLTRRVLHPLPDFVVPLARQLRGPKLRRLRAKTARTTTFEHKRSISMARDKAKDDRHFNCTETHEADYVAGLYPHAKDEVKNFLASACKDKSLHNSTHKEVYDLIKKELGHSQP
jgi:hypothetical protein